MTSVRTVLEDRDLIPMRLRRRVWREVKNLFPIRRKAMKVNEQDAERLVETATAFRAADRELDRGVIEERAVETGRSFAEVAKPVAERYLEARAAHQDAILRAEG